MTDAADPPTQAHEQSRTLAGVERWLTSPIRLATLASIAILIATLATSLGEVELVSAGGLDSDDGEVLVRQGLLWTLWAIVTPPLIWMAVRVSGWVRSWPLAAAFHLGLAAAVGAAFLCVEIKAIEWSQTAEETQEYARRMNRGPGGPGGPGGGPSGRGERRGGDRRDAERREADRQRPGPSADASERPGGADRPPPERRDEGDRRDGDPRRRGPRRWWRQAFAGVNISSGDLQRDFERRWPLRVPRYALTYLALVGIGLGIRSFLIGRAQEREMGALAIRTSELEADLSQARLLALKGQLHPHFLFNSLHSVGGLIRTERSSEALAALASIGDLLRTSLDAGPEQFVPLARELELVERYLDVEALRLGDRLTREFDVPERLLEAEVPPFIVQPLVENAIKHAIAPRTEGGTLVVRIRAERDDQLTIDVEDDGPGYSPAEGHTGVGIAHVRGRLEALFADGGELDMSGLPDGGTRARITMPLDDLLGN